MRKATKAEQKKALHLAEQIVKANMLDEYQRRQALNKYLDTLNAAGVSFSVVPVPQSYTVKISF
jgi:hypothetical protein